MDLAVDVDRGRFPAPDAAHAERLADARLDSPRSRRKSWKGTSPVRAVVAQAGAEDARELAVQLRHQLVPPRLMRERG